MGSTATVAPIDGVHRRVKYGSDDLLEYFSHGKQQPFREMDNVSPRLFLHLLSGASWCKIKARSGVGTALMLNIAIRSFKISPAKREVGEGLDTGNTSHEDTVHCEWQPR